MTGSYYTTETESAYYVIVKRNVRVSYSPFYFCMQSKKNVFCREAYFNVMCGTQTLSASTIPGVFSLSASIVSSILSSTFDSQFVATHLGVVSQVCITEKRIYLDSLCTQLYTNDQVYSYPGNDAGANLSATYNFNIQSTTPHPPKTFYICWINDVNTKVSWPFSIERCAAFSLTNQTVPSYSYVRNANNGSVTEDVTSLFQGISVACSAQLWRLEQWDSATSSYLSYSNIYITLGGNATVGLLQIDTTVGFTTQNLTIYVQDSSGMFARKNILVLVCGQETVLANAHTTQFNAKYNSILNNVPILNATVANAKVMLIPNFKSWITSVVQDPLCSLSSWSLHNSSDLSLFQSSLVMLDTLNDQIVVSTQQNLHLELVLRGSTSSGNFNQTTFKIDICGQETVKPVNSTSVSFAFDLLPNSSVNLVAQSNLTNLTQWLVNSDPLCPYIDFILLTKDQSGAYVLYDFSQIILNKTTYQLWAKTDSPFSSSFYLNASTSSVWGMKQIEVKICGSEKVKINAESTIVIQYDEESNFTIPGSKFTSSFQSSDQGCPIVNYSIGLNKTGPAQISLNNSIFLQWNTSLDVQFNFAQMNQTFPKNAEFYLLASTATPNWGAITVSLFKIDCSIAILNTVGADLIVNINETSSPIIPLSAYENSFSSSRVKCPILHFDLSAMKNTKTQLQNSLYKDAIWKTSDGIIHFANQKLYDLKTNELLFYIVGSTELDLRAFQTVTLKISPPKQKTMQTSKSGSTQSSVFALNFTIGMQNVSTQKQTTKQQTTLQSVKTEQKKHQISYKIDKISNNGQMDVIFNETMIDEKNGFDMDLINNNSIGMQVSSSENETQFWNFTWQPMYFIDETIRFQLSFEKPLMISAAMSKTKMMDKIYFKILQPEYFHAKSGATLDENELLQWNFVSKQLKNDSLSQAIAENVDDAKNSMNAVMILQVSLNFFMQTSLAYFISLFHVLQVICFQTMLNLEYPGNAQIFINNIISILNADILDPTYIYYIFNYDFSADEALMTVTSQPANKRYDIIAQVKEMQFETFNPILNMSGLYIVILFVCFQFLVLLVLKVIVHVLKSKRQLEKMSESPRIEKEGGGEQRRVNFKRAWQNLRTSKYSTNKIMLKLFGTIEKNYRRSMIWAAPLLVIQESLTQLFMSFILFCLKPKHLVDQSLVDPFTNNSSYFFGVFCIVSVGIMLAIAIFISFAKEKQLIQSSIFTKYGALYDELIISRFSGRIELFMFLVRRIVICFYILYMADFNSQQIQICLFQNLFYLIYKGQARPFKDARFTRKELVNEFCVLLLTTCLFLFTGFVPDEKADFKYDVAGWAYCLLLGFVIVFNLYFVLKSFIIWVKLLFIKWYKMAVRKFGKFFKIQVTQTLQPQTLSSAPEPIAQEEEAKEGQEKNEKLSHSEESEEDEAQLAKLFEIEPQLGNLHSATLENQEQNQLILRKQFLTSASQTQQQILDISRVKSAQRDELIKTLNSFIDKYETKLKTVVYVTFFKSLRQAENLKWRHQFLKQGFYYPEETFKLEDQEYVRIFNEFKAFLFFKDQLNAVRSRLYQENQDKYKWEAKQTQEEFLSSIQDHYEGHLQIYKNFLSPLELTKSESRQYASFSDYTRHISMQHIKSTFLKKTNGKIKRGVESSTIIKFSFFSVNYTSEYICQNMPNHFYVHKNMYSKLNLRLFKEQSEWQRDDFNQCAQLTSEVRTKLFKELAASMKHEDLDKAHVKFKQFYNMVEMHFRLMTKLQNDKFQKYVDKFSELEKDKQYAVDVKLLKMIMDTTIPEYEVIIYPKVEITNEH